MAVEKEQCDNVEARDGMSSTFLKFTHHRPQQLNTTSISDYVAAAVQDLRKSRQWKDIDINHNTMMMLQERKEWDTNALEASLLYAEPWYLMSYRP